MHKPGVLESVYRDHIQGFLQAKRSLISRNNYAPFPALYDLQGELIAALRVTGKFGEAWGILKSDDPQSKVIRHIQESQATSGKLARRKDRAKGIYIGYVLAPASLQIRQRVPVLVRNDGGFSRDVYELDNGLEDSLGIWYRIIEELNSL